MHQQLKELVDQALEMHQQCSPDKSKAWESQDRMSEEAKSPILYKCPYCVAGRFTAEDGWAGAKLHIKENHSGRRKRRKKPPKDDLLEKEEVCYSERELVFAPA